MGMSLIEVLREMVFFTSTTKYYEITGGMDALPKAFLSQLNENIFMRYKVEKIIQENSKVMMQVNYEQTIERFMVTGDVAIVTIHFQLYVLLKFSLTIYSLIIKDEQFVN